MGNYTPNPFMTQPIYGPTRPFTTLISKRETQSVINVTIGNGKYW